MQTPFSLASPETVSVTIHEQATEWLAGDARPAHIGVYQRQYPAGPYTFWDGQHWRADGASPEEAATMVAPSSRQSCPWRGLMHPLGASAFLGDGSEALASDGQGLQEQGSNNGRGPRSRRTN
jgi:hypothetical protein